MRLARRALPAHRGVRLARRVRPVHRAHRARLVVLACCLEAISAIAPLYAEDAQLFPREVFVGDSAELSFRYPALDAVLDEGDAVTVGSDEIPASEKLDVSSVTALKTGGVSSVTVAFVPWDSGDVAFPRIEVRGVMVTPPAARVSSILERTGKTSLESARSPLLVPGTTWLLYGIIAAFLAAVALMAFLFVRLRSLLFAAGGRRSIRHRTRLLSRSLRSLERAIHSANGAAWYAAYARAVRLYLGACLAGDFDACLALTGTEIAVAADGPFADRIAVLFSELDSIRFGGSGATGAAGVSDEPSAMSSANARIVFIDRARALSADLEAASLSAGEGGGDAGL